MHELKKLDFLHIAAAHRASSLWYSQRGSDEVTARISRLSYPYGRVRGNNHRVRESLSEQSIEGITIMR